MREAPRRRKLLVFAEDPGAANGVVGLTTRLAPFGITSHVVATGAAVPFLAERGERLETLGAEASAASLLDSEKPSAVLVGTAENPETFAFAIIEEARRRNIKSIGYVDAFTNAPFRWCGRSSDPLAHCPDHLLVSDAPTKAAFVALGVAPERISVCGHPQLSTITARGRELANEGRAAVRRRLFPRSEAHELAARRVVVFCGERSTTGTDDVVREAQFQRSVDYTLDGRGGSTARTQVVAEELLDALATLGERPFLVLRYHPKNVDADFGPLVSEFDWVSAGGSAVDVLFAADLVIGMTSVILCEAAALGRPTLSIVPRPLERDWLPSAVRKRTPCVDTRETLRDFLAIWTSSSAPTEAVPVDEGAIDHLCQLLVELVSGRAANAAK
jgi:hypothetical protein